MSVAPDIRDLLEDRYHRYCNTDFIPTDPISIPHRYTRAEDIEISGLFSATLAWGQRPTMLRNARDLMARMDDAPYDYVLQASEGELERLEGFVHRTFNTVDATWFVLALRHIYVHEGGLQAVFARALQPADADLGPGLMALHRLFFALPGAPARTRKHLPDVARGSAAKRLNMYLRWMVRNDRRGVDFGLWVHLSPALLLCPLDVHSGRVARSLGLLHRTQDDWRAVQELTTHLRLLDPTDPVKYDFALYGLGVFEKWR